MSDKVYQVGAPDVREPEVFTGPLGGMVLREATAVAGDKYYVSDRTTKKMLGGYFYDGEEWCQFEAYSV